MMRSLAAIAVALTAIFAASSCNDYGNTFQGNTGVFLAFISPSNVTAGGADLTITLTAVAGNSAFVVQTTVTWDQKNLKTCVVTTTAANTCAPSNDTGTVVSVTAVVPAALTAKAGTHFIQTVQPHSGTGTNGLSNPVAFEVFPPPNPVPTVTSISPNTATAGSAAQSLTITGTNFLLTTDPSGGSQVRWNTTTQTNLSVTNITATQIQATVPAAQLATAGTATVTVYNRSSATHLRVARSTAPVMEAAAQARGCRSRSPVQQELPLVRAPQWWRKKHPPSAWMAAMWHTRLRRTATRKFSLAIRAKERILLANRAPFSFLPRRMAPPRVMKAIRLP